MSYPGKSIYFSRGKFSEEFKYATNFLLDDKLEIENAEILTYIEIKKIMIFSALYLRIKNNRSLQVPLF